MDNNSTYKGEISGFYQPPMTNQEQSYKAIDLNGEEVKMVSDCCSAPVILEPQDEIGNEGATFFYVCSKCKKACNGKIVKL